MEPTQSQLTLALQGIPFLIDEDVPASVGGFLASRGHDVTYATEKLGRATPDEMLARLGDENVMVVVTCNAKDFRRLASRRPESGHARFRHLGLVTLECDKSKALMRIQQVIASVEHEYRFCQGRSDRRIFLEIKDSRFVIVR